MIVNKSMFPLQTGFGVISKMQNRFATLQMQLGTGEKASKLSEMGRDLPMSLSVRSRLAKIEGFSANIDTVNLRLSFLDMTMSRLDKMEAEARSSAVQGQYGTNNINMATLPGISLGRFDELVTLLNSDVAGRYLFGGSNTDKAPLPTTDVLLDGQGRQAGFKTVLGERKAADAGALGFGRLLTEIGATPDEVTLSEDGIHPFGLKLSNIVSTAGSAVQLGQVLPSPIAGRGDAVSLRFSTDPADQMQPGETISMGFTLPDGRETKIVLTAIADGDGPPATGQFVITDDAATNAANFKAALEDKLKSVVEGELDAASTFAAAQNFFNGPGEPVLRVNGNPDAASATSLRVATAADTVQWYSGQSPAISASNLGRLATSTDTTTNTVTLSRQVPVSPDHGFRIAGISSTDIATITPVPPIAPDNSSVGVTFTAVPAVGEQVEITLAEPPNGVQRKVTLTAVDGKAGPGQFSIGGDATTTAENFAKALEDALTVAATAAQGNPRQSVTAQVDDTARVNYGMQADEPGFLALMRTMAAMSVTEYPTTDDEARNLVYRNRFDAMAIRQQSELSEAHNSTPGSIEILTMELGVARSTLDNSAKRHTDYKNQLENLLSDVESVSKESVAMEILALQTRLQASYQATSMISKLSLVNFI